MKTFDLFLFYCIDADYSNFRIDPNCPDYNLNLICEEKCYSELINCAQKCNNDSTCLGDCAREEAHCIQACPCDIDCINGCSGCLNPICQCSVITEYDAWNDCMDRIGAVFSRCMHQCQEDQSCENDCLTTFKESKKSCPCEEKCPAGCPCDSEDCQSDSSDVNAVLVLSTYNNNSPFIVDFQGNINSNLKVTYGPDASVHQSCTVKYQGEFWILGGYTDPNQMSKILNCEVTRIGDMPVSISVGACDEFKLEKPEILICSWNAADQGCHTFDGKNWGQISSTTYPHVWILNFGNYKGKPFVTSSESANNKTEFYDHESKQWMVSADYPFHSFVSCYATASTSDSVYVFGGYPSNNRVAKFQDDAWTQTGTLAYARHGHGALTIASEAMVIGGYSQADAFTEIWDLENEQTREIEPQLGNNYSGGYKTSLFAVRMDFCNM